MVSLANNVPQNGAPRQSIADLTTDTKSTTGDVPPALIGASTTVLGDNVYVFGGRVASTRQMTNHLYVLHLPTLNWERFIPPPDSGRPAKPRYFHSASTYKDQFIVFFGGMGNANGRRTRQQQQQQQQQNGEEKLCALDDVCMFDTVTMSWVDINVPPSIFTPQARYAHIAAVWDSDKLVIVGGQDIANTHINEINVFDLTECAWVHGGPINGPYDAYRAVGFCPSIGSNAAAYGGKAAAPFWKVNTTAEGDKMENGSQEQDLLPVCIYSNYNFNDLTRDLQSFFPMKSSHNVDFHNHASEMTGSVLPPGLRFPTGQLMGHYFIVSGTFLSSSQHGFQIWALNLTNLQWSHIDTGNAMSSGSWNRGLLFNKKYYVLGHGQRDLKDDYGYRRINFDHITTVDLEAFGIYTPPPGTCSNAAQDLGLSMLNEPGMADLTVWTTDQQSIPANSIILAERWPEFAQLLENQETAAKTKKLRHNSSSILRRKQLLFPETYSVTLAFLQFIYTDHLITAQQHQPQILSRLLLLADMYNLERLRQLTTYALHQLLTISTASMVYETATLTFQSALQIRALRIMMNAKRMLLGQQQQQYHQAKEISLPPTPQQHTSTPTNDMFHQEWSAGSLPPTSPSSSMNGPNSTAGSFYSSSEEPISPQSYPSSPGYSNLRRLAQPVRSPSSSEQTQQQRYMYSNNGVHTPPASKSPSVKKQQGYFDHAQYGIGPRSIGSAYH